ncbi:MAG: amidohydrolase [Deltaproteobacteria bacterium]|nr:MAG: amidohydrolase [Deltaproteobacteria bacterium]
MQNPKVIDADGHIYAIHEEIEEYFEGKYRGMRRARAYSLFPSLDGWPRGLGAGRPDKVTETRPEDVIRFVDNMGLESTVLYPTAALAIGLVQEPAWACAISRAYNNWFHARYIKTNPRLKGVAVLPIQDAVSAAAELRYAVEKLDMVGAFLPSATVMNKAFGHPDFQPIFREAERLGVPLAIHGAPSRGFGFDYFEDQGQVHALEHPFPLMIQFTSIICDGVLEKFPRLKLAFLEAGCGWLPYMMDRLDYEYGTRGASSFRQIKKTPSDYVKECPVYVTCEPEETSLAYVAKVIGDDRLMFPSDYPHERVYGEFLKDIPELLARPELSDHTKQKILYDNAKEFYRI